MADNSVTVKGGAVLVGGRPIPGVRCEQSGSDSYTVQFPGGTRLDHVADEELKRWMPIIAGAFAGAPAAGSTTSGGSP